MRTTIEMAREAAGDDWGLFQEYMPEIHRLAELVRADERARMATDKSKDKAMKLALEALEFNCVMSEDGEDLTPRKIKKAITALREALAEQPAQKEPVAWMWRCKPYCNWPEWCVSLQRPADSGCDGNKRTEGYEDIPLYSAPQPQRQPQQEPVAWRTFDGEGGYEYRSYEMNEQYAQEWEQRNPKHKGWVEPLYTTPPPCPTCEALARTVMMDQTGRDTFPPAQRTWVGLTDEEREIASWTDGSFGAGARWAEAKLKEKNNG